MSPRPFFPGQFHQLQTAFQHGAFVTCSRKSQVGCRHRDEGRRGGDSKGLIEGHAYTLTSVAVVRLLDGEVVHLVRIRNPWGNSVEWQGDWNDKCVNVRNWRFVRNLRNVLPPPPLPRCVKWNGVSRADKERLRVAALADGEFWMNFEDFKDEFMEITVATLGPDFDQDGLIGTAGVALPAERERMLNERFVRLPQADGNGERLVGEREERGREQERPGAVFAEPAVLAASPGIGRRRKRRRQVQRPRRTHAGAQEERLGRRTRHAPHFFLHIQGTYVTPGPPPSLRRDRHCLRVAGGKVKRAPRSGVLPVHGGGSDFRRLHERPGSHRQGPPPAGALRHHSGDLPPGLRN